MTHEQLFKDWKGYAESVIEKFREVLPTNCIEEECSQYEQFPWHQGQNFLKELPGKREQFLRKWKIDIECIDN